MNTVLPTGPGVWELQEKGVPCHNPNILPILKALPTSTHMAIVKMHETGKIKQVIIKIIYFHAQFSAISCLFQDIPSSLLVKMSMVSTGEVAYLPMSWLNSMATQTSRHAGSVTDNISETLKPGEGGGGSCMISGSGLKGYSSYNYFLSNLFHILLSN